MQCSQSHCSHHHYYCYNQTISDVKSNIQNTSLASFHSCAFATCTISCSTPTHFNASSVVNSMPKPRSWTTCRQFSANIISGTCGKSSCASNLQITIINKNDATFFQAQHGKMVKSSKKENKSVQFLTTHITKFWGVWNPTNMSDIGFLKTEPNRPHNSKTKNSVSAVQFSKKTTLAVWGEFFMLSHSQFLLVMLYLCTYSSESLRLTISWTNSAWKYVISSIIP